MEQESTNSSIGRNEPCPCGSGKKYKRCCGVGAAPKLGPVATQPTGMPEGFDPSKLDPAWMMQFTQAIQRLPRGQMQRLQAIMQKSMSGKDVSREASELERLLPPDLQTLMASFQMPGMTMPGAEASPPEMTPEEARKIVEQAAAAGKLTNEQAQTLLTTDTTQLKTEESKSGISKLWKKVTGK